MLRLHFFYEKIFEDSMVINTEGKEKATLKVLQFRDYLFIKIIFLSGQFDLKCPPKTRLSVK